MALGPSMPFHICRIQLDWYEVGAIAEKMSDAATRIRRRLKAAVMMIRKMLILRMIALRSDSVN